MCWGAYGPRANPDEFSTLWPDDIAGIQANYRTLFGRQLAPPDWHDEIDLEAPLDAESPWPGKTGKTYGSDAELEIVLVDEITEFDDGPAIDL